MKKRLLLFIAVTFALMCFFAISVSAAVMPNYCTVKLTLTNDETVTAYCSTSGNQMQRDNLYKTPDNAGEKYNWEDVVIFDCRGQEVVGANRPRAFAGTGCNSYAKNVKEVYLSEYFTYFLNSTFTGGWSSLETVYITKTVTELKGFTGSPVKTVVIPDASELTTIGSDAFKDCTNLVNIDISHCDSLKNINSNAFRSCTSLTTIVFPESLETIGANCFYLSTIGGTIVVPNNVTTLGEGAFLSTRIETLIIGESVTTIKYNFLGTLNNRNNAYLKDVYLPATAALVPNGNSYVFFECANSVNFYVVGNESDCDNMVTTMKSQTAGTYMNFITADEVTEETGAGYGIIHTGYNRCDAFYGGVHDYKNASDPTSCTAECSRCCEILGALGVHSSFVITEEFDGERYVTSCTVVKSCEACGCDIKTTEVGKIFTWLGYSVPEEPMGETVGISQSFYIDKAALLIYEEAKECTLDYGVVAANGTIDKPILALEGKAEANGSLVVSLTRVNCFEIKIGGISSADFDTAVVFNAFVVEGSDVYYISGEKTTLMPVALSYNSIKNEA